MADVMTDEQAPAWRAWAKGGATGLVILAVGALAWTALSHLAADISYQEVVDALRATSPWALAAALGCTAISFLALTFYDWTALTYVGRKVPYPIIGLTSFCAYAVGNTVGFGPLTAGAIRYRFYTPHGLEPEEVARIVGFVTATFGLGVVGTTALGLFIAGDVTGMGLPGWIGHAAGAVGLALLAGLVVASGRHDRLKIARWTVDLPAPRLLRIQFAATLVDIVAAGTVLWVLLPPMDIGLPAFIAIYAVAIGLGVLSHVPAGLGVFETVVIAAVGGRADTEQVLGALLLYRIIYHVVPLLLAGLAVALLETKRAAVWLAGSRVVVAGRRLSPPVLGALTLLLASMLVFSGVTPADDSRLDLLSGFLPLPLVEGAHFLSSVLGLMLFVVARGITYRLDGAWWAAVSIVLAAMVLALAKALAVTEMVLLALLLALLLLARGEFTRKASLLHSALTRPWLVAVGLLLITALSVLFFVYKGVDYTHDLWWQFEFSGEAPRGLRALLGVALLAGMVAAWTLLRPAVLAEQASPDAAALARALTIIDAQPRPSAQLALLGDKKLLFSDNGAAFIMYARQGRSWIALFDPVGPEQEWAPLIWRFVEMARASGGRAVFYQVMPENLALYADVGLVAFKLGEEARIDLANFDLKGPKRANLRNSSNRCEKAGVEFALVEGTDVPAIMDELRAVSDTWMEAHNVREKRFSLGAFIPDYLALRPVAVLRLRGRIVAFASLMMTGQRQEASIDLMRFSSDAPPAVMEYLLLRLIQHFKAEGYGHFNLGMAPLSGLSASAVGLWQQVGHAVYERGDRFYNFSGLRAFKSKFGPGWEARYMAVPGGLNPMLALADITVLIAGGLRGVVGK
ncbi:MAG: bifunctional lysylphosphatidylglycerol flippase/synthetase MprF [Niveispirillum sp.]|uniref:bifunctional lysylphosphatidylglycerol flippase/synthetase MprF n=1 Tax=Niveispirillum sp. TaxID=1917217 RepID=UPI003BA5507E